MTYLDLIDHDEDKQIELIGRVAMYRLKTVCFLVDDLPGKADRYVQKLLDKFPGIVILERGAGPVKGVEYVKVAPPQNTHDEE